MEFIIIVVIIIVIICIISSIRQSNKIIEAKDKAEYSVKAEEAKKSAESIKQAALRSILPEAKEVMNMALKAANEAQSANASIKEGQKYKGVSRFVRTLNKSAKEVKTIAEYVSNVGSSDWKRIKILVINGPIDDSHVPNVLKQQDSYEAAVIIRDELVSNGFKVGKMQVEKYYGQYIGKMFVDEEEGLIICSSGPMAIFTYEMGLRTSNIKAYGYEKCLAFENSFGLLLRMGFKRIADPRMPPKWLKMAVTTYRKSGFPVDFPKWIHEHRGYEDYLNVKALFN